ncbi:MAG: hypothetical protein LBI74_02680, partial [Synergistaceae bacterium]|nr:hypothetical protein [Synergistaceae bacterium]
EAIITISTTYYWNRTHLIFASSQLQSRLEHFTEEMARHQEEIASLSESVTSIRLERAKERGYLLGALAVGSIIGWLAEKFIGL